MEQTGCRNFGSSQSEETIRYTQSANSLTRVTLIHHGSQSQLEIGVSAPAVWTALSSCDNPGWLGITVG